MSLKYLLIVALTGAATAACASIPQDQRTAAPNTGGNCEVKPDRKVASCGSESPADSVKASEEPVPSQVSAREPFHHRGRMGD